MTECKFINVNLTDRNQARKTTASVYAAHTSAQVCMYCSVRKKEVASG